MACVFRAIVLFQDVLRESSRIDTRQGFLIPSVDFGDRWCPRHHELAVRGTRTSRRTKCPHVRRDSHRHPSLQKELKPSYLAAFSGCQRRIWIALLHGAFTRSSRSNPTTRGAALWGIPSITLEDRRATRQGFNLVGVPTGPLRPCDPEFWTVVHAGHGRLPHAESVVARNPALRQIVCVERVTGTSRTGTVYTHYKCIQATNRGPNKHDDGDACSNRKISRPVVKKLVVEALLDELLQPERVTAIPTALKARRDDRQVSAEIVPLMVV
jgi:hypothetical protein